MGMMKICMFLVVLCLGQTQTCDNGATTTCGNVQKNQSSRQERNLKDSGETETACEISVAKKNDRIECLNHRTSNIEENRKYYKLTTEDEAKTIEFPFGEQIPFLDQTMDSVKLHTVHDEVDSQWLQLLMQMKQHIQKSANKYMKENRTYDRIKDYKELYREHVENVRSMKDLEYLSNPAAEETFTRFVENGMWSSDEMFVQQRLAGPCPFLLKLVTSSEDGSSVGMKWTELQPMLNETFDFDGALSRAVERHGATLKDAVRRKELYVLYEKQSNNVETKAEDFFYHLTGHQLEKITSPITLLSLTPCGDLKVVAIQMNHFKESQVFSPVSDAVEWMLAKTMVNLVEQNYCQSVWHLSHVHFSSSVYCNIYQGHLSDLHPLHHIMRHHCQGTTPHIALSWPLLVQPNGPADQFSNIGSEGVAHLMLEAKHEYRYGLLAYDDLLISRGLDSQRIKYHPFRDDGELLWREFQSFAHQFVDIFYDGNDDVVNDEELQSFANEVSADGTKPPFGGRGKVRGFPARFESKEEVEVFVCRFIWLVVMHAAVNYPMEPWYTFEPLSPPKLYRLDNNNNNNNNNKNNVYDNFARTLPDAPTAVGYLTYTTLLGNFRINRIMDHGDALREEKLTALVKQHHHCLHTTVQRKLEMRNAKRKAKRKMGFQYFEPKWLTNSIHI